MVGADAATTWLDGSTLGCGKDVHKSRYGCEETVAVVRSIYVTGKKADEWIAREF